MSIPETSVLIFLGTQQCRFFFSGKEISHTLIKKVWLEKMFMQQTDTVSSGTIEMKEGISQHLLRQSRFSPDSLTAILMAIVYICYDVL